MSGPDIMVLVLIKHSESSTVKVIRSMEDLETLKSLSNKLLHIADLLKIVRFAVAAKFRRLANHSIKI